MKEYVNKNFEVKIEINLARICGSKDDQLKIVQVKAVRDFTCELCGHQHLTAAYVIKNMNTGLIIMVGSECVNHFNIPQSDIDKAEGLMKLVEAAIRDGKNSIIQKFGIEAFNQLPEALRRNHYTQDHLRAIFGDYYDELLSTATKDNYISRSEVIKNLGNRKYKSLSRDEKFNLVNRLYRNNYAERLLDEVAHNEHLLTPEEVEEIVSLGEEYKERMDKAILRRDAKVQRERVNAFDDLICKRLDNLMLTESSPDAGIVEEWRKEAQALNAESTFDFRLKNHEEQLERKKALRAEEEAKKAKYKWLYDYAGTNRTVINIRESLRRYRELTQSQESYARDLIAAEAAPAKPEIETMFDALIAKFPGNTKYIGIRAYYHKFGRMSVLQEKCIRNDYANKCQGAM